VEVVEVVGSITKTLTVKRKATVAMRQIRATIYLTTLPLLRLEVVLRERDDDPLPVESSHHLQRLLPRTDESTILETNTNCG
jgi:hypothetical protein